MIAVDEEISLLHSWFVPPNTYDPLATHLAQTKVDNLDIDIVHALGLVRQEQVLRLEIAMDDVLGVHVHQRAGHLVDDLAGLLLVQRALGHDVIKQLTPGHELHDDVNLLVGNVHVVQRDDVGMVQAPQRGDFRVELLDHSRESLLDVLLVDDLAGVGLAVDPVDAAVAGGRRTDTQDFTDFVLFVQLLLGVLC